MDHDEFLKRVKSYIKTPTKELEKQLEEFCGYCSYVSGQYDKDDSFKELEKHLQEIEQDRKEQNRIFYMALPPSVFITVSQHLKRNCYPKSGISRVIVGGSSAVSREHASNRCYRRSRSPSARISRVRGSSNALWRRTGRKMNSTELTIT